MVKSIILFMPIKTVSELNIREHWTKVRKRAALQRKTAFFEVKRVIGSEDLAYLEQLKFEVHLTRFSHKVMDGDNLQAAFKHVRDGIADALKIDDGDERIQWFYCQENKKIKEIEVRITINAYLPF